MKGEIRLRRCDALARSAESGRYRMAAVATGAGLALLLVGGCGGSSGYGNATSSTASSGAPSSLPTALPTGLPTALPTGLPGGEQVTNGADALKEPNVPAGFPIPPGAKVNGGTSGNSQSTVVLTGVSDTAVANFYRTALSAAGYTITSDNQIPGLATAIGFRGHGVTGNIDTAGVGTSNGAILTFRKQ